MTYHYVPTRMGEIKIKMLIIPNSGNGGATETTVAPPIPGAYVLGPPVDDPICIYPFFSYTYTPMIKFNV